MSYQTERDEFIGILSAEGVNITTIRTLLREATVLQRLAELSCSSERADRDQVMCPGKRRQMPRGCPCHDYGSAEFEPIGDSAIPLIREHGTVPRIAVKEWRTTRRVDALCKAHRLTAHHGGDPRGCVLVVSVPSGRTNDWGRVGIAVPARGYTSAQLERLS